MSTLISGILVSHLYQNEQKDRYELWKIFRIFGYRVRGLILISQYSLESTWQLDES